MILIIPLCGIPENKSCGNRLVRNVKKQRDAALAGDAARNGELRAALKRRRRFFCRFCFWKSTIGVTVFSCRLYDPTRPAARGWLLPQAGGTLRADQEGAARDRRRSRSGRSRPDPTVVGGLDRDRSAARRRRDRRGNFPPCKALKTHKTAKKSRIRASWALARHCERSEAIQGAAAAHLRVCVLTSRDVETVITRPVLQARRRTISWRHGLLRCARNDG